MLTPKNFKCSRCADCCKYLTIKLYKKDIKEIKKAGYGKDFFLEYDNYIKSPILKKSNKGCIFLSKKKGEYYCKIYDIRPKICKVYPFVNSDEVESCKPNLLKYKFKSKSFLNKS